MAVKTINTELLQKMFLAGAANLEAKKEFINELNVFPVPDGDTGTNMTLTILSAAKEVKPRRSWDKITPELPLAPRREPEEIAFAIATISGFSSAFTSFAADRIVSVIFVPVSPSGTGNTFNSLMNSFFASRFAAPARNIF